MTIQELKDLVLLKITGQCSQIDIGGALPPVLNGILDTLAATQSITQVNVTVDEGTGTPSAEASVADGVLTLNFHNLKGEKGEQGNTGSSVDYPFELVNNLTTDDATKALSAAQGVVLDGKISQLGQKVTDLDAETNGIDVPYKKTDLYITTGGRWSRSSSHISWGTIIPVQSGDIVSITYSNNIGKRELVSSYPEYLQTTVNLLEDDTFSGESEEITISTNGYLVIHSVFSDTTYYYPKQVLLNGKDITELVLDIRFNLRNEYAQIAKLKEETALADASLSSDLGTVQAASVIQDEKIGNVETRFVDVPNGPFTVGTVKGNIDSTLVIGTSTGYKYTNFSVVGGEQYNVETKVGNSNNYPYYLFLTDNNNVINGRYIEKVASGTATKNENVTIPVGVTKMWVMQSGGGSTDFVAVKKRVLVDLQTQVNATNDRIDGLSAPILSARMMSDKGMFEHETDWWIGDRYLESEFAEAEDTALVPFLTKFRARSGAGVYQIAVISDTHGSGAYSWKNILRTGSTVCHRSIAVFNKVASYCDAALHGGDISTDYGTSRHRDLQYMYEIIRKFCFNKPFFITKGNHDENNNSYVEADMLAIDWANNTYYVRNFSTFTQVNEEDWDGSPLYINKTEIVSDKEFRNCVQHWLTPSGVHWGDGAYYFYDIESVKIRFIVANSFPVNEQYQLDEPTEYLWLAQTAFDLSGKDTPSDWKVVMLRHTQSTGLADLSNCINAFRNGTSWTYNETTVNFGTMNGGGITFIAHIHGHEHGNCFSNGQGYFDIGENSAFVGLADLGNTTKYGISVLTIDTANKVVYEDTIDGKTWVYNYNTGKLEIAVGDTFYAAASGLPDATACSSDTSVATCDGRTVTAVAAGECNITVSGSNSNSFIYPIKVV